MLVVVRFLNISSTVVRALLLMCLLVDTVEARHRSLLSARYTAEAKRATHESVADVSRTPLFGRNPGEVSPRGLFFCFF